jgi:hypothetical protein
MRCVSDKYIVRAFASGASSFAMRRAATGSDFWPTRAVRFEANVFQLAPPAGALTFSEVEVIQTIN